MTRQAESQTILPEHSLMMLAVDALRDLQGQLDDQAIDAHLRNRVAYLEDQIERIRQHLVF